MRLVGIEAASISRTFSRARAPRTARRTARRGHLWAFSSETGHRHSLTEIESGILRESPPQVASARFSRLSASRCCARCGVLDRRRLARRRLRHQPDRESLRHRPLRRRLRRPVGALRRRRCCACRSAAPGPLAYSACLAPGACGRRSDASGREEISPRVARRNRLRLRPRGQDAGVTNGHVWARASRRPLGSRWARRRSGRRQRAWNRRGARPRPRASRCACSGANRAVVVGRAERSAASLSPCRRGWWPFSAWHRWARQRAARPGRGPRARAASPRAPRTRRRGAPGADSGRSSRPSSGRGSRDGARLDRRPSIMARRSSRSRPTIPASSR